MDALELKDTTYFVRDFGDIHHGISSHRKKNYRFSVINFPLFNEK